MNQAGGSEFRALLESDGPAPMIDWLRHQKLVPELHALYGVEERKEYHPEGDSGIHLEMVVVKVWELCSAPEERAAAVLHDIGKTVTGRAIPNPTGIALAEYKFDPEGRKIANHIGHDRIGADMMPSTFMTLRLPTEWLPLATTVALFHQRLHQVEEMDSNGVARLVDDIASNMPGYSRIDAVGAVVRCVRADFNGRLGFESLAYKQGDLLLACARAMDCFDADSAQRHAMVSARTDAQQELFRKLSADNAELEPQSVWSLMSRAIREREANGSFPPKPKTLHAYLKEQLREELAAPACMRVQEILTSAPKAPGCPEKQV